MREKEQLEELKKGSHMISFINNPTKKVSFEAFSKQNKTKLEENFRLEIKEPLFKMLEEEKKIEFLSLLANYQEELQNEVYFEALTEYLIQFHREWVQEFINNMSPLTKKQQDIWNEYHFETLEEENKMTEKEQLQKVKEDPYEIKNMENPSEEVQLEAIKKSDRIMHYIKNPSKKAQMLAVTKFPDSFQYIKNPYEDVKRIAVERKGNLIKYIENPSETLQIIAIRENPFSFEYIKHPTKKADLELFTKIFDPKIIESVFVEDFIHFIQNREDNIFVHLTDKKEFFQRLAEYRKELQELKYFESLLQYFLFFENAWMESYVKTLEPLTKEQEDIWKKVRLKAVL